MNRPYTQTYKYCTTKPSGQLKRVNEDMRLIKKLKLK